MTNQFSPLTPEAMLSAPRRSPAKSNTTGSKLLYTVSSYSFTTHSRTSEIRLIDVQSGSDTLLTTAAYREPTWLSAHEILFLASTSDGTTLNVLDISVPTSPTQIAHVKGSLEGIRLTQLTESSYVFAVAAPTTPEGDLYHPSSAPVRHDTAKIYTSLFVRHWDSYVTENKNSIWYGQLEKTDGSYTLSNNALINALAGTGLESPVPQGPGSYNFDVSAYGIAFVAKDPSLDPALYTKTDLYLLPLSSFSSPPPNPVPIQVDTPLLKGYTSDPTFSHDGQKIIFTRMRNMQYESDKRRLLIIPDLASPQTFYEFYSTVDGKGSLDQSPGDLSWSIDDSSILYTAEFQGAHNLYSVPADPTTTEPPVTLHEGVTVTHYEPLGTSPSYIASTTSLIDNMAYTLITPSSETIPLFSSSQNGSLFGLSPSQCSDLWFTSPASSQKVHALVMKPSNFDPSKKYPLAFLIHGGPQGAWSNGWSTRWNPAVFAEHGYVTVACNPTGSTGYGQDYTDAIANHWGGRPYEDLVACVEAIDEHLPFVDMNRAVALGASYGGYMINWIAGMPLSFRFKALVCHDGIFSTHTKWATEELFFPYREFGGAPWNKASTYAQWDPAQNHHKWHVPMLVIHNELDYRLPISEGLAMFNVLQTQKIPSKFLMFPDENHWVLKPENSLVWHREVLSFIDQYTTTEA